jgi:hypothetical protein
MIRLRGKLARMHLPYSAKEKGFIDAWINAERDPHMKSGMLCELDIIPSRPWEEDEFFVELYGLIVESTTSVRKHRCWSTVGANGKNWRIPPLRNAFEVQSQGRKSYAPRL